MKFKANLANAPLFTKICQSADKIGKSCLLKLSPDLVSIIVASNIENGAHLWSSIKQDLIFDEYNVESISENNIGINIQFDSLNKALLAACGTLNSEIKLIKREGLPHLSFRILHQSNTGSMVSLIHDVPVKILNKNELESIKEPLVPEPSVHIILPKLKIFRATLEKLKSMHDLVVLNANTKGELLVSVQTIDIQIETRFQELTNPELDSSQACSNHIKKDSAKFYSVQVDAKQLISTLNCSALNPNNIVCCIIDDFALVFYVYVLIQSEQVNVMTFFIPAKLE